MTALINFVVIVLMGYMFKKLFPKNTGEILSTLIVNFTLPMTVFIGISSSKVLLSDLYFILIGFLGCLLTFFGGKILVNLLNIEDKNVSTVILLSFCGLNIGLFMYPLAEMLWGINAITYFALYDLGNSIILYGIGKSVAEGKKGGFRILDLLKFPPFIALILGLVFNLFGVTLPDLIMSPIKIIKDANNFLIMFLVGFYFSVSTIKKHSKILTITLSTKYLIGLAISLLTLLIPVRNQLERVSLFISPMLPTAMMVIVYSIENNYDSELASSIVSLTAIISFILVFLASAMFNFGI
ncbi:MAG: AEC family transporter [Defluviitoga tunisiensis]|uniref:Putative permeases n=1 Tax=Defluviitoga tunisiensis TaxID=1006576 RepID=A0A0C7P0Y6_DEFTU|nr:AEC family transporter [Defluviitoga tunisiensis]MDD3600342.1 AEC family transporter [Defluviitoga tunisiensis]MDY0379051.1 AEC family transporter [Defluviitoga tunisiensis]CEP77905.1 putative permeases [Defluviitoga tunisiensis]HOP33894.1 AEC family transporter [Defluviitoga tunisiensis]